jgi:choice-of-anchor B domain-containing protein
MKKFTQVAILCMMVISGYGQENLNMELVGSFSNGEPGNDVWGYVDSTGLEYAVMGSRNSTNIWSLEDPANPMLRASIPGPSGVWRDIKSFEDHLYVTSDQGNSGLLIIDMSLAPDSITHTYWKPTLELKGNLFPLGKCHNLYIDTPTGYCYLAGCNVSEGGVLILDLNQDKKEPVLVGAMDNNYSHDVYVQDDKMYTSDIFQGSFNVYDVSDKENLVHLNGAETSRKFTHNAWSSHDGQYLFTTDERSNAWVDAFDISDLDNIQFLDRYQPIETQGTNVIPHNTHYLDGFLITSWYTDGVVVVDAHEPDNLIKVASYDTELEFTEGFDGCWGAYPFLPSGLILAGDINHGLFIIQPKTQDGVNGFQRACYLEGNVTDIKTGEAIANAGVEILSNNANEARTQLSGTYKSGQVTPGEFSVEFSHPNYDSKILTATLESGIITILDAQLGNSEISGTVKDIEGNPIEGASVVIENIDEDVRTTVTSDEEGNWVAAVRTDLEYSIYSAKWAYKGTVQTINFTEDVMVDFVLEEGYEDDFFADLGWEVSGTASSGAWEIAKPNFIVGSGQTTQTSTDIETDLGETYYVTGADGGSQGANDIDDGSVILTSQPMDFTECERVDFSYFLWFANVSGNGPVNDFVTVSVTNGVETFELTRDDQNGSEWSSKIETSVDNTQMEFNDQMRVIVYAEDGAPGHVVEAGFDAFKAVGFKIVGLVEVADLGLSVFPNPSSKMITLRSETAWEGEKQITIFDNTGKVVMQQDLTNPEMTIDVDRLNSGIYSLQIIGKNKTSETIKFSKI